MQRHKFRLSVNTQQGFNIINLIIFRNSNRHPLSKFSNSSGIGIVLRQFYDMYLVDIRFGRFYRAGVRVGVSVQTTGSPLVIGVEDTEDSKPKDGGR